MRPSPGEVRGGRHSMVDPQWWWGVQRWLVSCRRWRNLSPTYRIEDCRGRVNEILFGSGWSIHPRCRLCVSIPSSFQHVLEIAMKMTGTRWTIPYLRRLCVYIECYTDFPWLPDTFSPNKYTVNNTSNSDHSNSVTRRLLKELFLHNSSSTTAESVYNSGLCLTHDPEKQNPWLGHVASPLQLLGVLRLWNTSDT